MIEKHIILNYLASARRSSSFFREKRIAHMSGGPTRTAGRKPAAGPKQKAQLKQAQEQIRKLKEIKQKRTENIKKYMKKGVKLEDLRVTSMVEAMTVITKLMGPYRTGMPQALLKKGGFADRIEADLVHFFKKNIGVLRNRRNQGKIKAVFKNGVLTLTRPGLQPGTSVKISTNLAKIDLKVQGFHLDLYNKFIEKRQKVLDRYRRGRTVLRSRINTRPNARNFLNLQTTTGPNVSRFRLVPNADQSITVKFPKRRDQYKLGLEQMLNLKGIGKTTFIRIRLRGVHPRTRRKFDYYAYYNRHQNKFYREKEAHKGKLKKAHVFHGTKLNVVRYRVPEPAKAMDRNSTLGKARARNMANHQRYMRDLTQRASQRQNSLDARRNGRLARERNSHDSEILSNDQFPVSTHLQEDKHFAKWNRLPSALGDTLGGPPFNVIGATKQKNYLRSVIQDGYNSRIYPADFFRQMEPDTDRRKTYPGGEAEFDKDYDKYEEIAEKIGVEDAEPEDIRLAANHADTPQQKKNLLKWATLKEIKANPIIKGRQFYEGGWSKFKADYKKYKALAKANNIDVNKINSYPVGSTKRNIAEEWVKLSGTMDGIVRVIKMVSNIEPTQLRAENAYEVHRPAIISIPRATPAQKRALERVPGSNRHNLKSLLHPSENGPSDVTIITPQSILDKLKPMLTTLDNEMPAELAGSGVAKRIKALVNSNNKHGLKFLFMSFGFQTLIEKGCLRRINDKQIGLVKLPTAQEIAKAVANAQTNRVDNNLWNSSTQSMKKWESIRGLSSYHQTTRNFIMDLFNPRDAGDVGMHNLDKSIKLKKEHTLMISDRRGYLDMLEKTGTRLRVGPRNKQRETLITVPNRAKLLENCNNYMFYALQHIIMEGNMRGNVKQSFKNLCSELNIPYSKIKTHVDKKKHQQAIQFILKEISLKGIPSGRSQRFDKVKKLIRFGYVKARQLETASQLGQDEESLSRLVKLSNNPLARKAQMEAFRRGCPPTKLVLVEAQFIAATFALAKFGPKKAGLLGHVTMLGGGIAAGIKLSWGTGNFYAIAGLMGTVGGETGAQVHAYAEGGLEQKFGSSGLASRFGIRLAFRGSVSLSSRPEVVACLSGAFVFPLGNSAWNMYIGGNIGVRDGFLTGGVDIGVEWDKRHAERKTIIAERNKVKLKKVQELFPAGSLMPPSGPRRIAAAKEIIKHPMFGSYFKSIIKKMHKAAFDTSKITNKIATIICDLYRSQRTMFDTNSRLGVIVPPVVGGGVSISVFPPWIYGYIRIPIPGSEYVIAARQIHPLYSAQAQSARSQVAVQDKFIKQMGTNQRNLQENILKFRSGALSLDSGRGSSTVNYGRENITLLQQERTRRIPNAKFAAIKETMKQLNIHVRKHEHPKHGTLIEIIPLGTEGSNVRIMIDPALHKKGLIFDSATGRTFLAASVASRLLVSRRRLRYPFRSKGALNLDTITFKTNPNVSDDMIRQESPYTVYKPRGERSRLVRGDRFTRRNKGRSNLLRMEQFNARARGSRGFESADIGKFRTNLQDQQKDSLALQKTMEYRAEAPVPHVRAGQLHKFAKDFFKRGNRKTWSKVNVLFKTIRPGNENTSRVKIMKIFKDWMKKLTPPQTLTSAEGNMMYFLLLDQSFSLLVKNKNRVKIEKSLKLRNNYYRKYLIKYFKKIAKSDHPLHHIWKSIQASAGIDKGIQPGTAGSKTGFRMTPESMAAYFVSFMPQNYTQLMEFRSSTNRTPITKGMRFGSYTLGAGYNRGGRRLYRDAFPTSYGPGTLKEIFSFIKPAKLNMNSADPRERAAAKLVLNIMSPLPKTKDVVSQSGEINPASASTMMQSDLAKLLVSMRDPKYGISPLIGMLGAANFKNLAAMYKTVMKRGFKPSSAEWKNLFSGPKKKPNMIAAFKKFHKLVYAIRHGQLNAPVRTITETGRDGKPVKRRVRYMNWENRYMVRLDLDIYAGAYLRCGNGSFGVRQGFALTVTTAERQKWLGTKVARNIRVLAYAEKRFRTQRIPIMIGFGGGKKDRTTTSRGRPRKVRTTQTRTRS